MTETMPPAAREIIIDAATKWGVTWKLIMGDCRWREVVIARAEIARRLARRGYSSPRIGSIIGKDHATVLYYLGRSKKGVKLHPGEAALIEPSLKRKDVKVTREQREELIRLAAEGGHIHPKKFGREIGCSHKYGLVLLQRGNGVHIRRWRRALAIGLVSS